MSSSNISARAKSTNRNGGRKTTTSSKRPGNKARTSRHTRIRKRKRSGHTAAWLILSIIIAVIGIFLCNNPITLSLRPGEGAKVPDGYGLYAVDLSHHNAGKIVWDSLKVMVDMRGHTTRVAESAYSVTPVSYVIFKASEGSTMRDKQFRSYWKSAAKAGIRRGAYHFYRSSKDPMTQARNYIKATGKLRESDLPPILDIETTHKGYSRKTLNNNALIWLQAIEKHYGRKPMVYSSESFIRDILSEEIKYNYPIWVARYRHQEPESDNWYMWQFTDKAVVSGIDGYVDLNVIRPGRLE